MAKIIRLSEQKKSYSDTYVIFCGKTKCKMQKCKSFREYPRRQPIPRPYKGRGRGWGRQGVLQITM